MPPTDLSGRGIKTLNVTLNYNAHTNYLIPATKLLSSSPSFFSITNARVVRPVAMKNVILKTIQFAVKLLFLMYVILILQGQNYWMIFNHNTYLLTCFFFISILIWSINIISVEFTYATLWPCKLWENKILVNKSCLTVPNIYNHCSWSEL